MTSKINVRDIFKNHDKTLLYPNNVLSKADKRIFVYFPFLIAGFCVLFFRIPNGSMINMLSLSLSVFIGMFLNLLVLIMTFVENKFEVSDAENRRVLLEHVFYNLSYTIVISLITLGLIVLLCAELFPEYWIENPQWNNNAIFLKVKSFFGIQQFTARNIFNSAVSAILYYFLSKIVLTLLMIIKRIFKLFNHELEAANVIVEQKAAEDPVAYD